MKFEYKKSLLSIIISIGFIATGSLCFNIVNAETTAPAKSAVQQNQTIAQTVEPLSVVNNPKAFLNKNIVMKAKFDKFSTLGLDYKPAYRSADKYISFLIKRDDTNYNIPLSEMKLFLDRDTAKKFIDLNKDDEIQIKGLVFSDALGDAWVDVKELTILKKTESEKKA